MNMGNWDHNDRIHPGRHIHINTLPVELLSCVFDLATHCPPDSDEEKDVPLRDISFDFESVKAPLCFSSVCRRWRSVAHSTPSLWTNLCASVGSLYPSDESSDNLVFNPSHFISYLGLSKNYPLDILIDARDQAWDFSEPEIPSRFEYSTYTPPFDSTQMDAALSLLTPHVARWRSIMILTDTWAPMYAAVFLLNTSLYSWGAPSLECLTLIRCNEFVSHSPVFQPAGMKNPAFLCPPPFSANLQLFPKLQDLVLAGVHADWATLGSVLQHSSATLQSLEISSHSTDVRPTYEQFHEILLQVPDLQALVLRGSGPYGEDPIDMSSRPQVSLHHLEDLTVGYRSSVDAGCILRILNAPNLRYLTLEDVTHPGDPEELDGGAVLSYIALGNLQDHRQDFIVTYSVADGIQHHHPSESSSSLQSGDEDDGPRSYSPFPQLEELRMLRVKAFQEQFRTLYAALPKLCKLKLKEMSIEAVVPLMPPPPFSNDRCVCPQLRFLSLKGFRGYNGLLRMVVELTYRPRGGACAMEELSVCLSGADVTVENVSIPDSLRGMRVRIYSEVLDEDEDELEDSDDSDDDMSEDEEQAFQLGGAFNDPVFDDWILEHAA